MTRFLEKFWQRQTQTTISRIGEAETVWAAKVDSVPMVVFTAAFIPFHDSIEHCEGREIHRRS